MKIGIIISNLFKLPPKAQEITKGYSGAPENIGWQMTEELVRRGHNVTLFASGDSQTNARLLSVNPIASSLDTDIGVKKHIDFEYYLISKALRESQRENFDLIHSHIPTRTAIFASFFPCPLVATLHSPLKTNDRILLGNRNSQYYISISNNQRKPLPSLNYLATIYHGIDIHRVPFSYNNYDDRLRFVGRIIPGKGLHTALRIARKTKQNINIYGDVPEEQKGYFQNKIAPQLNKGDKIYGFQPQNIVWRSVGRSRVMLFPIEVEEPFGLVMIEAMACGTPVVAFARGAVPEIVKDGETGYIVNYSETDKRGNWIIKKTGLAGLVEAVKKIYVMPEAEYRQMRQNCRRHVEKNFTAEKMVDGYERVYQKVIEDWKKRK